MPIGRSESAKEIAGRRTRFGDPYRRIGTIGHLESRDESAEAIGVGRMGRDEERGALSQEFGVETGDWIVLSILEEEAEDEADTKENADSHGPLEQSRKTTSIWRSCGDERSRLKGY